MTTNYLMTRLRACRLGFGLVVATATLPLCAQQPVGGDSIFKTDLTGDGSWDGLTVIGPQLTWFRVSPVDHTATLSLPFTSAGGISHVSGGKLLICGWDDATSKGVLLRVSASMQAGQPILSLTEQYDLGVAIRPGDVQYSQHEGALVILDSQNGNFHMAPWVPGGAIVAPQASIAFPLDLRRPVSLRQAIQPGEIAGSVYADSFPLAVRAGVSMRYRPHKVAGVWNLETTDLIPTNSTPTSSGWAVKDRWRQSDDGIISLQTVGGGTFLVNDVVTGFPVMAGVLPAAPGWYQNTVPTGAFVPGRSYVVTGSGQRDSRIIWPTYRRGQPTSEAGLALGYGKLHPSQMADGNQDFAISGRLTWTGPATMTPAYVPYYLWVRIGLPGPLTTHSVGGAIVIKNPDLTYVGEDPVHVLAEPGFLPIRQKLPLPSGYAGAPILFQWLALTDQGDIIVSDVFGSRIRALTEGAFANSGSSPTPPSPSTLLARRVQARSWLRSQRCGTERALCASLIEKLGQ
jgi:hypothetical protein